MKKSKTMALIVMVMIVLIGSSTKSNATGKPTYVNGVLLVNKQYSLPKNYSPGESKEARSSFEKMKKDAGKNNIYLNAFSTYRSYSYQHNLYWNYVKKDGQEKADTYSARPGNSEHQTGLGFDIGGKNSKLWANSGFNNSKEAKWLKDNAYKYGFILRYEKGKEHITGYRYESWHYRYVGVDLSIKINNSGLCLEEYLGVYKNGWYKLSNKWYYYQNNKITTGWKKISNKWYYLNTSGDMSIGWKKISGEWYYLNEGGDMATGWKKISGEWYYLNEGGDMATGWKKISGEWYYLNEGGDTATGWKKISGEWYYLNESGDMATGWKKISDEWYYLNEGGDMATNWKKVSNEWYYLNKDGQMLNNKWELSDNNWYWLTLDGSMAKDETLEIDGVVYEFNSEGISNTKYLN